MTAGTGSRLEWLKMKYRVCMCPRIGAEGAVHGKIGRAPKDGGGKCTNPSAYMWLRQERQPLTTFPECVQTKGTIDVHASNVTVVLPM